MDHRNVDIAKIIARKNVFCVFLCTDVSYMFVYLKPVYLVSHKKQTVGSKQFVFNHTVWRHKPPICANAVRFVYLPRDSNLTQPLAEHALFSRSDVWGLSCFVCLFWLVYLFSMYWFCFPLIPVTMERSLRMNLRTVSFASLDHIFSFLCTRRSATESTNRCARSDTKRTRGEDSGFFDFFLKIIKISTVSIVCGGI